MKGYRYTKERVTLGGRDGYMVEVYEDSGDRSVYYNTVFVGGKFSESKLLAELERAMSCGNFEDSDEE